MINPDAQPIDVDDMRDWLIEHRHSTGLSYNQLSKLTGIHASTLSVFKGNNYKGDNDKIARELFRYRQSLSNQKKLTITAPEVPTYFETATSKELMTLLTTAHRGRLTFCAGGPGIGKTETAKEYRERAAQVWLVTVLPSMNSINKLCMAVLRAMNDRTGKNNSTLSQYILNKLEDSHGLLIFDDAQHLNLEQVEEIRGWYDITGTGVALLGNEEVVSRMQGGSRQAAFAQLYSRVGLRMIRNVPLRDDIIAMADEWQIQDEKAVQFLMQIGRKPGGLRSCTHALEIAGILAKSKDQELSVDHISAAWAQLNHNPIAA